MKLKEFAKEMHWLVDAFEKYWEEQSKVRPEAFDPNPDYEPGDWDEQFRCFEESNEPEARKAKS